MLNFNFPEKDLDASFSTTFFVWFFKKIVSLAIYQWPNFIVWLSLLLEILGNTCIEIFCSPGCDVIKFEISLIFLIKPFYCRTKKSWQKFKYLENGKHFIQPSIIWCSVRYPGPYSEQDWSLKLYPQIPISAFYKKYA